MLMPNDDANCVVTGISENYSFSLFVLIRRYFYIAHWDMHCIRSAKAELSITRLKINKKWRCKIRRTPILDVAAVFLCCTRILPCQSQTVCHPCATLCSPYTAAYIKRLVGIESYSKLYVPRVHSADVCWMMVRNRFRFIACQKNDVNPSWCSVVSFILLTCFVRTWVICMLFTWSDGVPLFAET